MTRRRIALGATVVLGALGILVGGAAPAYADNCSGLSDCSPSVYGAVTLLGGLAGLGILAAVSSSTPPPSSGSGSGSGGSGSGGSDGGGQGPPGGGSSNPPVPPVAPTTPPAYNPDNLGPRMDGTPEQQEAMRKAQQDLASKTGQPPQNWIDDINPTHDMSNCVETAKAVDKTLGNQPTTAGPVRRGQSGDELQDAYPGRPDSTTTLGDITRDIQQSGPGSRGIVTVYEGGSAHSFNVYNDNGHVVWIDGQNGTVSSTPGGVMGKANYTNQASVSIIKTYP